MNLSNICAVYVLVLLQVFNANTERVDERGKIQVAFILDTSGSMDQLLNIAKSQFWHTANHLVTAKRKGRQPVIECAVMTYGMEHEKDFCKVVTDFNSDLDSVAWKLSQVTINGSTEYCWTAIHRALTELSWTDQADALKLIIIAGNESFNQENYDYKRVLALAVKLNVVINTIYCKGVDNNAEEFEWKDAAKRAKGSYFSISLVDTVDLHETAYDQKLVDFNEKLNATYLPFGANRVQEYSRMLLRDATARIAGAPYFRERMLYKISETFRHPSWDLVDAFEADSTIDLNPTRLEILGKQVNDEIEVKELIEQKKYQREAYKEGIRLRYELIKRYVGEQTLDSDLELVMKKILYKEGRKLGYEFPNEDGIQMH